VVDYEEFRRGLVEWLDDQDYSDDVVRLTAYRLDQWFRWVWDRRGYTTEVDQDDADEYVTWLAESDYSNGHKRKCTTVLKRYFRWRDIEWDSDVTFKPSSSTNPRDFLTQDERTAIREAALEYGSVPSYQSLSPEQRSRWKAHLAQRFEKPKSQVSPDDFERANGWKYPSLVWAAMDAGLRPVEVNRARVQWVDHENSLLRIPKTDSDLPEVRRH
jgi:integrase